MTATQIEATSFQDSDGVVTARVAGAVLWIGSILLAVLWHPMIHIRALDEWFGQEARVPVVACMWPAIAVASMKLRRQKVTLTAVFGAVLLSAVVIAFILALGTEPI